MSLIRLNLENDICRCCHSEGKFTNLAEPCPKRKEAYSDKMRFCFDINLCPVPGILCSATYKICSECIIKLQDALDFKNSVLACEEKFQAMLVKLSSVKIEKDECDIKEEPCEGDEPMVDAEIAEGEAEILAEKAEIAEEDDDIIVEADNDDFDEDNDSDEPLLKKSLNAHLRKKAPVEKTHVRKTKTEKEKNEGADKTAEEKTEKKRGHDVNEKNTFAFYTLRKEQDGTKSYVCTECSRVFKTRPYVVQHYNHVHLRQRPKLRSCFLCKEKVPGHLRAFHMEKHGVPPPTCDACGKKFNFPNQVLRHQQTQHMGEKKFSCEDCDMTFSTQANLRRHSVKHSDKRVHKCQYCDKGFKWKNNLKTHVMAHLNDKRHVCSVCNEAFVQLSSLKYHMTKRHPELV